MLRYLVSVHVTDAPLFQVCVTWKYNKTVCAWVSAGRKPDGVEAIPSYNFALLQIRYPGHSIEEK